MTERATAARRLVICLVLTLSIAGCGQGTVESSTAADPTIGPPATPAATSSPLPTEAPASATPAPTRAAASPASLRFESEVYPYAITLPPGAAILAWKPAERPWDGTAKLERAVNPYADRTTIAEGGLYLFGAEDPGLETWFGRVEDNGRNYHGCGAAENRVDVTINGVPAIAFTQTCASATNMARVALWKDGFGIGVWLGETTPDKLVAVRDRAVELLSTLEWTTD